MTQVTIQQAMQIAMGQHRKGELGAAESIYRQVLKQRPDYPDALHLLGVIATDVGKMEEGIALIRRAIALNPSEADYHSNLGNALGRMGKLDEAIEAHRAALRLKPDYAEVHYNLGNALLKKERIQEAIGEFREAVRLKPEATRPHNNLGHALYVQGEVDEAIAECARAAQLDPRNYEAYFNLGLALHSKGRFDEAIAATREVLRMKPENAGAHYNLANSLHEADRYDEAIAEYREALRLKPDYPEAHNNLGIALRDSGRLEEAKTAFLEALNIGNDNPPVHWNLALNYLLQGKFKEGWEEHEWRWQCKEFPSPRREFPKPMWDGRELNGQAVLLHAEQGFGDTIQFVRYVPMVAERGGRVVVQCPEALVRLLKSNARFGEVIAGKEPLPEFDFHCPLLSLPRAFGTEIHSIPGGTPYLWADGELADAWDKRLAPSAGRFRVGIVWTGRPTHKRNRQRSIALSEFLPLAEVKEVEFFGLQKGAGSEEVDRLGGKFKITDFTTELNDFADTAALISRMDLVIGADTAVVHLAGALGKPVWVLLPWVPDWRWLMEREDSPWYPTMRLFRQQSAGDWGGVFRRVLEALRIAESRPK